MNSFGSQLQFTFACATQQAIDLVIANRLTIGTSDEWVLALALVGSRPPWFDTFAEVRQTGAFVTSGRVERRLLAILAADVAGVPWLVVLQRNRMSLDCPGFVGLRRRARLTQGRIESERGRTVGQLRLFAEVDPPISDETKRAANRSPAPDVLPWSLGVAMLQTDFPSMAKVTIR